MKALPTTVSLEVTVSPVATERNAPTVFLFFFSYGKEEEKKKKYG